MWPSARRRRTADKGGGSRLTTVTGEQTKTGHNKKVFPLPFMIWHCGAGHLDVLAAEEEEHGVASQTEDVEEDHQLDGPFRPQLESLEDVSSQEDPDAGTGDGDAPGEHAGRALAQVELGLEVLRKEDDEAGDDDELHAGAETSHDVDLVGKELPGGSGYVLDVLPVAVVVVSPVLSLPFPLMVVLVLLGVGVMGFSGLCQGLGFGLWTDARICGVVILLVDVDLDLLFLQRENNVM